MKLGLARSRLHQRIEAVEEQLAIVRQRQEQLGETGEQLKLELEELVVTRDRKPAPDPEV